MSTIPRSRGIIPDTSKDDGEDPVISPEDEEFELNPAKVLPNPSYLAAEILLRQLFKNALPAPRIGASEIAIVRVPDIAWISFVADAVPTVLLGIDISLPKSDGGRHYPGAREAYRIFERTEPFGENRSDRFCDDIAGEIRSSKAVIIITHDENITTPEIVRHAVDHVFTVQGFDTASFSKFLIELTGAAPDYLPTIALNNLHPHMLQLAYRPRQTAEDYCNRLVKLAYKAPKGDTASHISFEDLHGMPELRAWARTLAVDIAEYKTGLIGWNDVDRGALLFGPPGCGKTTAARAIADYCKVPFIPTSYSVWQSAGDGYLGDVTRSIRNTFQKARAMAPAILFIDELDTVSNRDEREKHSDWWRSIINTLLQELDGAIHREGVVVIGATNHPGHIDSAIKRAGRLDREIKIALPDVSALEKIFSVYVGGAVTGVDLGRLANMMVGRSGADVEKSVRGARRKARSERRPIAYADILSEILGHEIDPQDPFLQRIAIHESGHAISILEQNPGYIPTITLGAQGRLSGTTFYNQDKPAALTSSGVDQLLVTFLCGRAAEEVILGNSSAGAGGSLESDLSQATQLAIRAETSLGLGTTGLLWSEIVDPQRGYISLTLRPATEAAVRARLDAAYKKAKTMIQKNRSLVERLSQSLLLRSVLIPSEITDILNTTSLEQAYDMKVKTISDRPTRNRTKPSGWVS
jgi:ATP-dependent Zn protease